MNIGKKVLNKKYNNHYKYQKIKIIPLKSVHKSILFKVLNKVVKLLMLLWSEVSPRKDKIIYILKNIINMLKINNLDLLHILLSILPMIIRNLAILKPIKLSIKDIKK